MAADKKTKSNSEKTNELPGGGNIDNIREIIFGAQMRQYEKRFLRIEEQLNKQAADLNDEMQRRLNDLESFIKHENQALAETIKAEKEERKAGEATLGKDLDSLGIKLEKKAGTIEEKLSKNVRDLRSSILDQSKSLSGEIKEKNDNLLDELSRRIEELREEKTDRAALASLFTEMAMRLGDEFKLPEGGE